MIHWFINSLYECCFGKKKRVKFMVADKVEELSQHEIEQLRKLYKTAKMLLVPFRETHHPQPSRFFNAF